MSMGESIQTLLHRLLSANNKTRLVVQSLDFTNDAIARGYGYFTEWEQTDEAGGDPVPAATGKRFAIFTTPADKYMALGFREVTTNQERGFYRVYNQLFGAVAGAAIPINKLKPNSPQTTGCTLTLATGATGMTTAARVTNVPIFGTTSVGGNSSGGVIPDTVYRLLPPDTQFLLEFTNNSANAAYMKVDLAWLELPLVLISDGDLIPV